MRFACEGCGKRYATAAPLAPGQILRITCNACGHLVEVRAPGEPGAGGAPPPVEGVTVIDTEPPLGELPSQGGPAPAVEEPTFVELFADGPPAAGATPSFRPPSPGARSRRATPAPRTARVPDIPTPPPRRRAAPLFFIAAGVLALLGILTFVLLRGAAVQAPVPATTAAGPISPPTPASPPAPSTATAATPTPTPPPPAPAPAPATARSREQAMSGADPERKQKQRETQRDARERERRDRRRAAVAEPAGRLTSTQVQRALASGRKAFDRCLETAGRTGEVPLDGRRVVLRLNVQGSGAVTYPTLDDVTLNRTELGGCLKAASRKLAFPRFRGGPMRVEVPLVLAAR